MDIGSTSSKLPFKPMTLMELLPDIGGILTDNAKHKLTAMKNQALASKNLTDQNFKPMTLAQLSVSLKPLQRGTPNTRQRMGQVPNSSMRKRWNSSVKPEKKRMSHIPENLPSNFKHSKVKKVLNFQPNKPTISNIPRMSEKPPAVTPKFQKPKPLAHLRGKCNPRISGIYNIQETPASNFKKPLNKLNNKENILKPAFQKANIKSSLKVETPSKDKKNILHKGTNARLSRSSDKSTNSDISFLQKEKDINNLIEQIKQTPPMSTPFKDYRSVHEFFNDSSNIDDSQCKDTTVMLFDKSTSHPKEESGIIILCDLMNKATFDIKTASNQHDIASVKLELEKELMRLKHVRIQVDKSIKCHEDMLLSVERLVHESVPKLHNKSITDTKIKEEGAVLKTLSQNNNKEFSMAKQFDDKNAKTQQIHAIDKKSHEVNTQQNKTIGTKVQSPTYKIPKLNPCLRKSTLHKSVPNNIHKIKFLSPSSPVPDKALYHYMKIKENCSFLTTPVQTSKQVHNAALSTPALTSRNLKQQLDKLYNGSP